MMRRAVVLAFAFSAACGASTSDGDPSRQLVAGERAGPIVLGMRWSDVLAVIGPPPSDPVVLVRIGHAAWPALGLEALVTSPDEARVTNDALVIGAGATIGADLEGAVLPGDSRIGVETSMGAPPEEYGGRVYYPAGLAVEYDEGARARRVGVVAPYTLAPVPPPMTPALGGS
jgi:hypothetical protein